MTTPWPPFDVRRKPPWRPLDVTPSLWRRLFSVAIVVASCVQGDPLGAQTAWETPRMIGPDSPEGLGFYWVRYGALPGDGSGLLATWKAPGLPSGVSLRGGAARGAAGTNAGFAGLDLRSPLASHSEGQPLDLVWTTGAGLGVGEYLLLTVPIGISVGRTWSSGAIWLAPYLAAGAAMDFRTGEGAPDREFEVSPTLDVGADLAFDPGRRFVLRFATALGDRSALAVGASVRMTPR